MRYLMCIRIKFYVYKILYIVYENAYVYLNMINKGVKIYLNPDWIKCISCINMNPSILLRDNDIHDQ